MDCIETAMFKNQTQEEKERLLHMVSFFRRKHDGVSIFLGGFVWGC